MSEHQQYAKTKESYSGIIRTKVNPKAIDEVAKVLCSLVSEVVDAVNVIENEFCFGFT